MNKSPWLPRVVANMAQPKTIEGTAVAARVVEQQDAEDLALEIERTMAARDHAQRRLEVCDQEYNEARRRWLEHKEARGLP